MTLGGRERPTLCPYVRAIRNHDLIKLCAACIVVIVDLEQVQLADQTRYIPVPARRKCDYAATGVAAPAAVTASVCLTDTVKPTRHG